MKRFFALLLAVIMLLALAACGKKKADGIAKDAEQHAMITKAVELVKKSWQKNYDDDAANGVKTDRYFEIKNTRVVVMKNNAIADFQDIEYIIEFEIYTDYLGTSPYYQRTNVYNNVLVHYDGRMEAGSSAINNYMRKTPKANVADFIEAIEDYHGAYNCSETLK